MHSCLINPSDNRISSIKDILLSIAVSVLFSLPICAQKIGDKLPEWAEGYLDIHHINTGCGNCTFMIFPDGTTMLVDAGENKADNPRHVAPRSNSSKTSGDWIVDYI